jgi:hypothetical protein
MSSLQPRTAAVACRDPFIPATYVVTGVATAVAVITAATTGSRWALLPCAALFGWVQIGGN